MPATQSPVRTPRGRDILAACGQLKSATEELSARGLGVACDGDDGIRAHMSISRVLVRLLLVPLAGVLAGCAATLVAFFAHWNVFLSVIGGDAMTNGDVLGIMVGLAMLLVSSAATFPMLLPAVIGVTISEALALRSVVFHTLNGVVSIWVGRTSMVVPGRPFEFHDHPPAVLAAGLAAGLVYWLIAGRSAGLAADTPRPRPVPPGVPKTPGVPNPR